MAKNKMKTAGEAGVVIKDGARAQKGSSKIFKGETA
jgi:hypothetical protein